MPIPKMGYLQFLFFFTLLFAVFSIASQAEDCKHGNGGSKVAYTVVVDKYGRGKFKTIQEAIDSIPANNNQWIKVQINPGIYTEQVYIPIDKPCILLQGKNRRVTTITYNAHTETGPSATFTSSPDNIVAKGITFKNSYNRNWMLNSYNGSKVAGVLPALSARIYGDKSAFYGCGFLGFQDTLWDANGRHHFLNCYIEGAVDFIYGAGQSFYEDCFINVTSGGFITAQGRESATDPSGFVFSGGIVTGLKGTVKTYLGRAYRAYSRVIFHRTYFSDVVEPQGWNAWHYVGQEHNFMYAEVDCQGPGSRTSGCVPWVHKTLEGSELRQYSRSSFIDQDGWLAKLPF